MRICGRVALLASDLGRATVYCMYATAQIVRLMYATARNQLWRSAILEIVKFRAKVIVQKVSVRTDMGSVDNVDGFLDQTKRVSK